MQYGLRSWSSADRLGKSMGGWASSQGFRSGGALGLEPEVTQRIRQELGL